MILVILVLSVLAVGVVLAVIVSRTSVPGVEDAVSTQSFPGLPTGPIQGEDLQDVRLDVALRGYRMDQVDVVLARLADELAARDAEIDRLRREDQHGNL